MREPAFSGSLQLQSDTDKQFVPVSLVYSAMSVLESQRYALEDLDRLEQAIADRLLAPPKSHRAKIAQQHEIAKFLERIQQQSKFLLTSLEDPDGLRANEIEKIHGGQTSTPLDEFYKQYKEIKDFHRRYPNEPVDNLEENYRKKRKTETTEDEAAGGQSSAVDVIESMFTGEEHLGRYLDLVAFHERYLNIRGVKRVSYVQYFDVVDKFAQISKSSKDEEYFKYITALSSYLQSFLRRTQPLNDPDGMIDKIGEDFEKEWEEKAKEASTVEKADGPVENGWYCSACDKVFEKQTVYDAHFTGKKHKKNAENKKTGGSSHTSVQDLKARVIALREYEIVKLFEILAKERADTKVNVERKSALTVRERQLEMEALEREENGEEDSEDEDGAGEGSGGDGEDGKIYNPLKLPIGWDGKPIPFWLWKLHGLGVEYPCEICGNFVYMGRKAFDKHFVEPRHIHGLRCLGIQNSSLFREITSIQDALTLWNKIKREKRAQESMQEQAIEVEDDEGNVMSEKVYNDLKKQGLL
ncbi:hypothetical protein BZA70DRAFT_283417 [Myxozyma melibiosi]|uniref:Matrin-type domain-containing protein n=1 Tax=Myxozyma melibiosi TaxID=54550 RepID=A0ABR1F0D7_9ASCO